MIDKNLKRSVSFLVGGAVGGLLYETLTKSKNDIEKAYDQGVEALELELKKQTMKLEFEKEQAKIAQEYSIAEKIRLAQEVKIEEFYDVSGEGNLGVGMNFQDKTGSLGLRGKGQKVTKRVYYFNGTIEEKIEK